MLYVIISLINNKPYKRFQSRVFKLKSRVDLLVNCLLVFQNQPTPNAFRESKVKPGCINMLH